MIGYKNIVTGFYKPTYREFPIYGAAADIKEGAVVMAGTTEDTDRGMAIIGTSAAHYADAIGVLASIHDYSVVGDSPIATGKMIWGKVDINPFNTYLCEWDQTASTMLTAASGTTTYALTGWRRTIEGGWLYIVSGAGKGQLRYIKEYANDAPVVSNAFSPAIVAADKAIAISPPLHALEDLNSTADKLLPASSTAGAVCSGVITVLQSFIKYDGRAMEKLDANKHDSLDGLDTLNPKFYSEIFFGDHQFNPA